MLIVVLAIVLAGAPIVLSADPHTYIAFIVCSIWAPVAFILLMLQQATGKSRQPSVNLSDH